MREKLPKQSRKNESGIVNLDSSTGPGTHWVCYKKLGDIVYYFDSFGNLQPPPELVHYLRGCKIYYNYNRQQGFNSVICGHLCLKFLSSNVLSHGKY
jgi:hypothetical protein